MGTQSQVELQMKWCRFCSDAGLPSSAAMFRIDLRPSVSSRPRRYCMPFLHWSLRDREVNRIEQSSVSRTSCEPGGNGVRACCTAPGPDEPPATAGSSAATAASPGAGGGGGPSPEPWLPVGAGRSGVAVVGAGDGNPAGPAERAEGFNRSLPVTGAVTRRRCANV